MNIKGKAIFWGWYVVFGAFTIMFITYGVRYSFGVFVKPMFIEYNWPMTIIQLGASTNLLIYALSCVLFGFLLDRFTPRWIMIAGIVLSSAGLILASQIKTPLGLYLSYGFLVGAGTAGCGMVVNSVIVAKWFNRHKGLALGLSSMGIGVGTMLMAPLAGYIVEFFGWRNGFLFAGVLMLVVGIFVCQTLMRKTGPEQMGLLPDGDPPTEDHPFCSIPARPADRSSLKQVLKTMQFWLLVFCNGCAVMTVMMAFNCQIDHAINQGVNPLEAAAALGLIGVTGSCGKLFFGWFCDHLQDAKYLAATGFVIMAIGIFFLYKTETVSMLYTFALIYGFGYGSLAPVMPYLISNRFEKHVFGSAYGLLIFFATGIGGGIGPVLGGYIFDKSGSYELGWLISIGILLLAAGIILALKPKASDLNIA
jgi:MFS family permease